MLKKIIIKTFIAFVLCFSSVILLGGMPVATVEAAMKAPVLKESSATLYVGEGTYTIKINNLAMNASVTYKSGDATVATVTGKGVVKPLSNGSSDITVAVNQNNKKYSLKFKLIVKKSAIELINSTPYMNVGETFQFKAKAHGVSDKIIWSSSDTDVATISASGKVTVITAGNVVIYAKAGKLTAKCEMVIGNNRISTFSNNLTIYNDTTIYITTKDDVTDETLTYSTDTDNKIVSCKWATAWEGNRIALTISPKAVGTDTITIITDKTSDELLIHVTVVNEPKDRKKLDAEAIYEKCGADR